MYNCNLQQFMNEASFLGDTAPSLASSTLYVRIYYNWPHLLSVVISNMWVEDHIPAQSNNYGHVTESGRGTQKFLPQHPPALIPRYAPEKSLGST